MGIGTVITAVIIIAIIGAAIYAYVSGWPPGPNDRK